MNNTTLIHNAIIVNEGTRFQGYIVIENEYIKEIGRGAAPAHLLNDSINIHDAEGAYLLPGGIDDQVHFRDPGLTHKADMATESRAAVAGGITSFMDMPNTIPQTVTLEALDDKHRRAAEVSVANYSFYIGATNDNINTLLACDYTKVPGVKLFLGASTGNMLVDNCESLNRIFAEVPALIAIHSEDEDIIRRNREVMIEKYGEDVPVEEHPNIRSAEACYKSSLKAAEMARKHGARLHILHISTADEMQLLSNEPLKDKKITAEVCAHHLWWTADDHAALGARIKWNPAIKTDKDRQALRDGLNNGLIDIVATDHAPHLLSEKQGGAIKATSGAPLVQYSLPMMLQLADEGVFTIEQVVDFMAHRVAQLFSIEKRGYIREGYYADLTIVKPNEQYTVKDEDVLSRCGWTPLAGTTLNNKVISTYVNGQRVFHKGTIDDSVHGKALKFTI
ncbi:MAG: dihydroorotase [Muribaculaceae bacterium]|nr:dihydroorotase [Muribaculaceae bacterium]